MAEDELERLRKEVADLKAEGGSYRNLQVALDNALQRNKDLEAVHTTAVESLKADHLRVIAELRTNFAEQHDKAMKDQQQASQAEITKLKSTLIPQLKDLQARQKADAVAALERQHQEELEKLK